MADAFCEMKGDTEKDRGNVRYRVKSSLKRDRDGRREGAVTEQECARGGKKKKKKREDGDGEGVT